MEGFNIGDYKKYFKTENIEIVRWDKIDFNSVRLMFLEEPLKTSAQTLLEHVKMLSKEEIEQEFDGISTEYRFDQIIDLIDLYASDEECFIISDEDDNGESDLLKYMMSQNEARLGTSHFNDPYWILSKHLFMDILRVLESWSYINSKEGKEELDRMIKLFGINGTY